MVVIILLPFKKLPATLHSQRTTPRKRKFFLPMKKSQNQLYQNKLYRTCRFKRAHRSLKYFKPSTETNKGIFIHSCVSLFAVVSLSKQRMTKEKFPGQHQDGCLRTTQLCRTLITSGTTHRQSRQKRRKKHTSKQNQQKSTKQNKTVNQSLDSESNNLP